MVMERAIRRAKMRMMRSIKIDEMSVIIRNSNHTICNFITISLATYRRAAEPDDCKETGTETQVGSIVSITAC